MRRGNKRMQMLRADDIDSDACKTGARLSDGPRGIVDGDSETSAMMVRDIVRNGAL